MFTTFNMGATRNLSQTSIWYRYTGQYICAEELKVGKEMYVGFMDIDIEEILDKVPRDKNWNKHRIIGVNAMLITAA